VTAATKYIITTQVQNNSTAPTVVTLQQANAEGKWLTLATDEVYATKDVSIEVTPNFSSPMRLSYSLRKGLATDNITVASINYIRVDKQASSRLVILCNTDADFSDDYRYGFNGMEKDNEIKGEGNSINYKARIYDDRLGKFLSVDPLTQHYPWYTPYQFAGNTPIQAIDMDGLEELIIRGYDPTSPNPQSIQMSYNSPNPDGTPWPSGSFGYELGQIDGNVKNNATDQSAYNGIKEHPEYMPTGDKGRVEYQRSVPVVKKVDDGDVESKKDDHSKPTGKAYVYPIPMTEQPMAEDKDITSKKNEVLKLKAMLKKSGENVIFKVFVEIPKGKNMDSKIDPKNPKSRTYKQRANDYIKKTKEILGTEAKQVRPVLEPKIQK
jgi:RHS repeat-associated protein